MAQGFGNISVPRSLNFLIYLIKKAKNRSISLNGRIKNDFI